jgi:hypothetical protein
LLGLDGANLTDGLPTSTFDYRDTILSQYANSPIFLAMLASLDVAIDQCPNVTAFYWNVWNIRTAVGYGLDVWGRIVGVGRYLNVAASTDFGFAEPGDTSEVGFNQGQFYSGAADTTTNYAMSDSMYRQVILAKSMSNLCDGSIREINIVLRALFPSSGTAWVTDGQNMTMTYTFNWFLSPVQYAIVTQTGVLPRPCGVAVSIVQL